jgi:hypothetical protein
MTQQQLADAVDTHVTHVSRLESDQRTAVGRDLLDRLGETLGARAQLAAAAGRLPPLIEKAISEIPAALDDSLFETRTLPILRRLDAAARAARALSRVPGGAVQGGRIDPNAICRRLGFDPQTRFESADVPVVFRDRRIIVSDPSGSSDPAALPRARFLLAHAAAHAIDSDVTCAFPRMAGGEQRATDIASYLLCPPGLLDLAFRAAVKTLSAPADQEDNTHGPSNVDPIWTQGAGNIVTSVALRLAVPGWVALRRLADESLLDDEALCYRDEDYS